eukprot:scaffold10023_cov88-Isochrysis_galbana.AAC.2
MDADLPARFSEGTLIVEVLLRAGDGLRTRQASVSRQRVWLAGKGMDVIPVPAGTASRTASAAHLYCRLLDNLWDADALNCSIAPCISSWTSSAASSGGAACGAASSATWRAAPAGTAAHAHANGRCLALASAGLSASSRRRGARHLPGLPHTPTAAPSAFAVVPSPSWASMSSAGLARRGHPSRKPWESARQVSQSTI